MSDLIDRAKAIKAIEDMQDCYNGFSSTFDKAQIIEVLEDVPKAETVTKCKDCIYWGGKNMSDLIDRQTALDALDSLCVRVCQYLKKQRAAMCGACPLGSAFDVIEELPSAEPKEIGYLECSSALLKMWVDNVVTDGEYRRISEKLEKYWAERRKE